MEETYLTPFQTHSPMEPHATIAVWDGPQKLTLYDTSQGIFGDRKRVADLLGLQPEDVRVVSLFVGGGFGSKGPTWSHSMICAMAARHVNRPVKLVMRRPQMFGPVGCRTATKTNDLRRGLERWPNDGAQERHDLAHVDDGRIHRTGHDARTDAVFDAE